MTRQPNGGASAAFADPGLAAEHAHPVWLPETGAARLHFTAHAVTEADGNRPGLSVSALSNVEHILVDAVGRQHAVLRSGGSSMQLVVRGCGVIARPVALVLSLCDLGDIDATAKALAGLARVLSGSQHLPSGAPSWKALTRRLRDALIALDCRRAGASLRETAVVIYGRKRTRVARERPAAAPAPRCAARPGALRRRLSQPAPLSRCTI